MVDGEPEKKAEVDSDEDIPIVTQNKGLDKLDDFGKADPHILKVYEMVCKWRVDDTVKYAEERLKAKQLKEKSSPPLRRIGRLISRLIVFAVLGYMVYPRIESFINEQVLARENPDHFKEKYQRMRKQPRSEEEIRRMAMEREERERAQQRRREEEFEQLYNSDL